MLTRTIFSLAVLALAATPVVAQEQKPDPVQILSRDWSAYTTAQDHVAEAMTKLAREYAELQKQAAAERQWWAGYLKGLEGKRAE